MRTIAHVSDLHFGKEDRRIAESLVAELRGLRPTVVAVSGDLTQRARSNQFRAARAFLDALPFPKVVVPGNHDLPLWNLARRLLAPLASYRRHVTSELAPAYADDELLVLGVSTARAGLWKEGRISREQIAALREAFCAEDARRLRVLVAHHPFTAPAGRPTEVAGRSRLALSELSACGLDLLLSGHLHRSARGDDPVEAERPFLAFHAGSAISERLRGDANSYNWIEVDDRRRVELTVRTWTGEGFAPSLRRAYERDAGGWRAER